MGLVVGAARWVGFGSNGGLLYGNRVFKNKKNKIGENIYRSVMSGKENVGNDDIWLNKIFKYHVNFFD